MRGKMPIEGAIHIRSHSIPLRCISYVATLLRLFQTRIVGAFNFCEESLLMTQSEKWVTCQHFTIWSFYLIYGSFKMLFLCKSHENEMSGYRESIHASKQYERIGTLHQYLENNICHIWPMNHATFMTFPSHISNLSCHVAIVKIFIPSITK